VEDLKNENMLLMEGLNSKERENILVKKTLEKQDSDLKNAYSSLKRANSLLEAHQVDTESYGHTEQKGESEYRESSNQNYNRDYSPYGRKTVDVPPIKNLMSPYDSPIGTFKRQPQPSQTSSYFANTQSLTPKTARSSLSKDFTQE
jgi:hypothetical protein